jgi:hypothetical protein
MGIIIRRIGDAVCRINGLKESLPRLMAGVLLLSLIARRIDSQSF